MKTLLSTRASGIPLVILLSFSLASILIQPAYGAAGELDAGFDGDGKLTTAVSPGQLNEALALAVQADGKIIAAGRANFPGTGLDFAIVRYLEDGSLDPSFGGGGSVVTDFLGGNDEARAVAVQSDGSIVVAGYSGTSPAVARYLPDGALDPSFGSGGLVTITGLPSGFSMATAVLIQPDGRIVVAGRANQDFLVARLNADGTMDTAFGGSTGFVITDFDGGIDYGHDAALQADGKIVVAGLAVVDDLGSPQPVFGLARYNADGTLDFTFGVGGLVKTTGFSGREAYGVGITQDGRIVAAGFTDLVADFAVARYLANGQLDPSFGGGAGFATTDLGTNVDFAYALVLQADDKPVLVGRTGTNPTGAPLTLDFAVVRYNTDGSPDTTFGTDGIVITDIGVESGDVGFAGALQADGKILAAGWSFPDRNNSFDRFFALVRYLGVGDVGSQIVLLIEEVEQLVADGVLNQGQGRALLAHLQRATMHLDAGREAQAVDQLEAFIQIVQGFRQGGILPDAEAQSLISQAQSIIDGLPAP